MAKESNSKWPKASVAIIGTVSISAAAYLLKTPEVMWSMVLLLWIVNHFD